eukprot:gene5889-7091_t
MECAGQWCLATSSAQLTPVDEALQKDHKEVLEVIEQLSGPSMEGGDEEEGEDTAAGEEEQDDATKQEPEAPDSAQEP